MQIWEKGRYGKSLNTERAVCFPSASGLGSGARVGALTEGSRGCEEKPSRGLTHPTAHLPSAAGGPPAAGRPLLPWLSVVWLLWAERCRCFV